MNQRSSLFGVAVVIAFGLAAGACGGDNPTLQDASTPDASQPGGATLTSYVIDLVTNHSNDPTPAAYTDFSTLPDPDGDTNNVHAYDTLFQ